MARRRRNPEIIAGRVNADGTLAASTADGVSSRGSGVAGGYVVGFPSGFRLLAGVASPAANTSHVVTFTVSSDGTASVSTLVSNTTAGANAAFHFVAVGVQQ